MPTTLTSLPARLETYSCSLSLTLIEAAHASTHAWVGNSSTGPWASFAASACRGGMDPAKGGGLTRASCRRERGVPAASLACPGRTGIAAACTVGRAMPQRGDGVWAVAVEGGSGGGRSARGERSRRGSRASRAASLISLRSHRGCSPRKAFSCSRTRETTSASCDLDAISRACGRSEANRGHPRSSEVIRGHQRTRISRAIRRHQASSGVIRRHQASLAHLDLEGPSLRIPPREDTCVVALHIEQLGLDHVRARLRF